MLAGIGDGRFLLLWVTRRRGGDTALAAGVLLGRGLEAGRDLR